MKVITFSTHFPANHTRRGIATFFPEQILCSLGIGIKEVQAFKPYMNDFAMLDGKKKVHTIRAGTRWKEREYFSPRIWTGKPYRSKQLQFAPPIQIKKIWTFETKGELFYLDGKYFDVTSSDLPMNDGLSSEDFFAWFDCHPKKRGAEFSGQVLCWDETIKYPTHDPSI